MIKNVNAELITELSDASRLLADGYALSENKNYGSAIVTLNSLFEKHPGSPEMAEGRNQKRMGEEKSKSKELKLKC